jgi:hypothetical protein
MRHHDFKNNRKKFCEYLASLVGPTQHIVFDWASLKKI